MDNAAEKTVYEIVDRLGRATSVGELKEIFGACKRNEVERAVLKNLRSGRMWLNHQGLRVRR
jgi:hypothetical protein